MYCVDHVAHFRHPGIGHILCRHHAHALVLVGTVADDIVVGRQAGTVVVWVARSVHRNPVPVVAQCFGVSIVAQELVPLGVVQVVLV